MSSPLSLHVTPTLAPPPPPRILHPQSLPLHSKNPHVLSRDITRLSRLDRVPEALTILDYLDRRGIPATATALSALLSAASRRRRGHVTSLKLARALHSHLRVHSLLSSPFLLSKLLLLYPLPNALSLLEELEHDTPFLYNALLDQDAHHVFDEMRRRGIPGNEYTYTRLLKFSSSPPAKIQALLVKNGLYASSVLVLTALINLYFKRKKVRAALDVFDEMPDWSKREDVVVWGVMIAGFAHNCREREAVEYFRLMGEYGIEANSVVLTSVLPAVASLSARNLGREIHAFVLKRFRVFDKVVGIQSALIDMYCKCGDLVSGRRVFYWSKPRTVVSWTALMSGYASNGRFEQALLSVVWMQKEGVEPDVVTIATAVPVCSELKAVMPGKELHAYALKRLFFPNISLATSFMTFYSECGNLNYASRMFDGMDRKSVISWTAMIDCYIRNERFIEAVQTFRAMRLVHHRLDAVSIRRVLNVSGELGASKLGREIHGQVYKLKFEDIPFVTAELMKMYGKCGNIKNASQVFDGVHSKGSLTCTAIIEAYGFNGHYKEAVKLFKWMRSCGFIPNQFTFYTILAICEQAGLVEDALDAFESMVMEYKLEATREQCDCIINLLDKAGRMNEAQKFLYLRSTLD